MPVSCHHHHHHHIKFDDDDDKKTGTGFCQKCDDVPSSPLHSTVDLVIMFVIQTGDGPLELGAAIARPLRLWIGLEIGLGIGLGIGIWVGLAIGLGLEL